MNTQAVCFDMDGVVVNSEPSHYETYRRLLENAHSIELSHSDYQHYFAGKTSVRGLVEFFAAHNSQADIAQLLRLRDKYYADVADSLLTVFPSTVAAIQSLASRNYPLALVTSAVKTEVDSIINRFNLFNHFSVFVCANDVSTGKPDPEAI